MDWQSLRRQTGPLIDGPLVNSRTVVQRAATITLTGSFVDSSCVKTSPADIIHES